jgi:DNA uptake protein ComE-like DNA-binding protein
MKGFRIKRVILCVGLISATGALACLREDNGGSYQSTARPENERQQARDENTRNEVANATTRAKDESLKLAQKLDDAGQKLEHQAGVVAQGVREGLNRGKYPLDLNSAPESDLAQLPGLSAADARRIVERRPYNTTRALVAKKVLTSDQYEHLKDLVTVKR